MRSTLVIGGTRNLGPELVVALARLGDQVTVLNRGQTAAALPGGVARLIADRGDPEAVRRALAGRSFDVVVDTTLYSGPDAHTIARLLGGRVGRYVMWSTGQVYLVRSGLTPPFREVDYEGPFAPEPPAARPREAEQWRYGVHKRAAEDALREAHEAAGFPAVILRMPMIHSVRDHYARIPNYVHRLLDGGPIVVPDEEALPIRHVCAGDVIAATLAAAERPVAGSAFNISQDESLAFESVLAEIAALCGSVLRLRRLPRATLEALDLLPACSPFSGRWMSVLDNHAARQALGLAFTPMSAYLPGLVEAARQRSAAEVPGYEQRPRELAL
ncbi:MAG TPA: NAD-dependent epimerase/dehydratase family protein [Gemmatimonadales bacterium]|nr:NAD-dependent epimerase/dehydratase family protein [Gemmatimonadales bacterium]